MPKMRTRRSAAKRVRATGGGKLMRRKSFSGCHHIREKKSPKRKRNFRKMAEVSPGDERHLRRIAPYL